MFSPQAETVAVALTLAVVLGAILMTYRRQRYWERRARLWQGRLGMQLGVLRALVSDARETQHAYRETADPVGVHAAFIVRCDGVLRNNFGDAYVTRIERRLSEDWLQPPGLASDEHIFAWYDTERRIAALQELINETSDELASMIVA